jgi:hypothetical protein
VSNKGVETTQKPLQHEKINNNVVHFILECFGQNIIAFYNSYFATLKIKIVFSNDLTSGTTWQNCNGATAKKKINFSATDYNRFKHYKDN